MQEPIITVLSVDTNGRSIRLRLEGGDIVDEWKRPSYTGRAWCEVVIYLNDDRTRGEVGVFGGEVWPGAWPSIFDVLDGAHLTDHGLELVFAAIDGIAGGGAPYV